MKCRKCRAGELICRAFFFSFQFAYHLLHLPLLTPEGLRGDFDLNRKSRVVWLRISSSLHSAGKTLELCLDSETEIAASLRFRFTRILVCFKETQSVHQIPLLSIVRVRPGLRHWGLTLIVGVVNVFNVSHLLEVMQPLHRGRRSTLILYFKSSHSTM